METTHSTSSAILRALPRVDDVMAELQATFPNTGHMRIQAAARDAIASQRQHILNGGADIQPEELHTGVLLRATRQLSEQEYSTPRRVLNGTGIIVHTGLGRSLLSRAATEAISRVAQSYSALEVDIDSGERGRRDASVAVLLRELTGCQDATVVNNCAGATIIALSTLAAGREVICARGELVEIGGGFRMPDVMAQSGARLREVGCTNKTRLSDYANAVTGETGALLKVHTSNYRIVGFTSEVSLTELVQLGRLQTVPVIEDLGSGALIDFNRFGLTGEPRVQDSVMTGADVVCFSGDKLLGGPQCGVLCGSKDAIERIRANSLMRALRVDKFTLAALEATLRHYRDQAEAVREIPTLAAIAMPAEEVKQRAQKLARLLRREKVAARVGVLPSHAQAGAGALPTQTLPSFAVTIVPQDLSLEEFARRLRNSEPSVWGRIHDGAFWIDCRTLRDEELKECAQRIIFALWEHFPTQNNQ